MNVKKKARRVMSGLLTAVTVLSTVLSPAVAYASDDAGSVKKIPYYEEIKDQLDEDEVVTAKDYEIKVGDNFDVKSDYTGLTIQDDSKVKVTFQEAKDTDGNDFSTDYANSYKAVYYVEPQTTDHPTYQINRKIVVKEADQQKDSQSESSSDQDAGSSDETETEDSEAGSSTEETGDAKTESKTELTEKEFDAEIEATENQETVDPETGITLSEVMQEAVDQEVALADLEAGESITFDMPMMLASGETGTKSVTVTAGSWYYYADYGLGSYLTCPYYVKWGSSMRQHTVLNHRKKDREMELIQSRNLPMERHLQRSAITEQKQVMRMISSMRNIRIFRQERDSSLPILQQLMQMDPVTGHPELMQQERTWQWSFTIIV